MNVRKCRRLVVVLGDQLDEFSSALDDFDPARDMVWMAEVKEESTHVWSSKVRTVLFLSAMRHFRDVLRAKDGWSVDYVALDSPQNTHSLGTELARVLERCRPAEVVMTPPGDWRVEQALRQVVDAAGSTLALRDDTHFYCTKDRFAAHAKGRKQLRLEFFYREMRREFGILVDGEGNPEGGQWNFDTSNRGTFNRHGPGQVPPPMRFEPDKITLEVMALAEHEFADHPGDLAHFDWPVTRAGALKALADFCQHRLQEFGRYQDAMWTGEPWLFHSRLSAVMNLKLLSPREVVAAAIECHRNGTAPLAAVEGFVRQILGWREYVRGIYGQEMPGYLERNAMEARQSLPKFYWDGQCEMNCLRDAIGQTLKHGYAHHIQRLMVTGLYGLLLGVDPRQMHEWYLAVYVDAVEWVELPNTLGMSQYADGGLMASKPYIASGKYIQRMSNACAGCRFDPGQATGDDACPFTTLYWHYLDRHQAVLKSNHRMGMQLKNLSRLSASRRTEIGEQAQRIFDGNGQPPRGDQGEMQLL